METTSLVRWVFLPYCLIEQDDGSYVVVNRRYKPVGITRTDFVRYEEHPVAVRFARKLSPAQVAAISHKGDSDASRIYLYDDGCIPTDSDEHWDAYSKRLQRLAGLDVKH